RDIAMSTPQADRRTAAERFGMSVLREVPQIAAFYVGDDAGDFAMVRRNGDGVEMKQIVNDSGRRTVTFIERNAAGEEMSRREDPTDTYDPRTRPWFKGARNSDDVFWTGAYIFFSDHKPGVTVSIRTPHLDVVDVVNGNVVFGVDVTLEELSRFLS